MNFKKQANGSWVDTPNYIHKASTDIITTLPAVIYPTGTTATVGLKGNAVQSSTPAPSNPVEVNGFGERTANLSPDIGWVNGYIDTIGELVTANAIRLEKTSDFIPIQSGIRIAYSYRGGSFPEGGGQTAWRAIGFYKSDKTFIDRPSGPEASTLVVSIPNDAAYIRLSLRTYGRDVSNVMLNVGSTALPYEPYGYKIPISSINNTTPVYLEEVETTRKIKKVVLTGSETLIIPNTDELRVPIGINLQQYGVANNHTLVSCTHFIVDNSSEDTIISENNFTTRLAGSGATEWFFIPKSFFSGEISVSNCRSQFAELLATQYAAGTPVTFWYVLAEPETAIINEPLMKIGDYADEVSGIAIPVTAGGDTLSVGTMVQPSEVAVNYKGWHPIADMHERTDGVWT